MANPSKAKGTAAESAVLKHVREHGFPWAERLALAGAADCGDISLLPGRLIILEIKSTRQGETGQPPDGVLAAWSAQTEAERVNAGADHAALIVKRKGTTDPARWFAYVPAWSLAELIGAPDTNVLPDPDALLCTSLGSLLPLLRAAGYGTTLDERTTP